MIKRYNVILTEQFNKEFDNILYNSLSSPSNLKKFYFKIKKSLLNLSYFQEKFYRITDIQEYKNLNIRRFPIDKFVIIYQIDKNLRDGFCSSYILW